MQSIAVATVRTIFLAGAFASALLASFPAGAEKRVALVVGNNAYESVPKLEKAVNDAKAVSSSLQALGFQVQLATDLGRRDFIRQLSAFMDRVGPGDLALFYYAGHGIEVRGVNYILPTDVPPVMQGQESLLTGEAVPTEKIISDLQDRGARATVFVLDACRDNPFKTGTTRSLGGARGLAQGTPPEGVFVLYSAGVGQSALDRMSDNDADPNSVFTRVFLKEIPKNDNTLVAIAKSVQVAVRDLSQTAGHTQVPAYYDQIIGQLYIASVGAASAKADQNPPAAGHTTSKPPVFANVPSQQSSARPVFNNRAFSEFLGKQSQHVRAAHNWANPNAVATCDRLASYGPDVPDSRAPRVALDDISVKEAVPACIAAVLQDSATPRLRAQLARALLQSPSKAERQAGFNILLDLANDGYPAAMWRIGVTYSGSAIKKDDRQAVVWFRRAADKGLGAAMSDLAYKYETGEGVARDQREAARWFERAAASGHPGGMRNFALVLDKGEAVGRNAKQSAEYLLTAFRMGSASARKSLFELNRAWHTDTRAQVQELLKNFGFYKGRTDGEFDAETYAALTALQSSNPIVAGR